MDFSRALDAIKQGWKATRNGWSGGTYVVLRDGELVLHVGNSTIPWRPTTADLLADDWLVASPDGTITWPDGTTDAMPGKEAASPPPRKLPVAPRQVQVHEHPLGCRCAAAHARRIAEGLKYLSRRC